jgi:hypothetical protein
LRLEEVQKMRRDMGWVLYWYAVIAGPLFLIGIILTWGDGLATFISCLLAFYGIYHFVDGLNQYRWMKREEDRLRRAHAITNKEG